MINEMLKTAGVNNVEDFYKLHPTEEHFFKTYPHMKDKVKKGRKIRRAQKGGLMPNSLSRPSVPIDYHSRTAANKMHFANGGIHPNSLNPASPAMNLDYRAGNYPASKLRMQEGGDPQQAEMQQLMQMISGALQQGAEPRQIMEILVKEGIPAEAVQQLIQAVIQQMQGGQEEYANGGKLPREVLRSRLESHMSPSEADEYLSTYAQGGIHIDPAKKGTFRAQATRMGMSVKEAARHIMANKENYSPAMVKKAVFAHNFAKQNGGYNYAIDTPPIPDTGVVRSRSGRGVIDNNPPTSPMLPSLQRLDPDPIEIPSLRTLDPYPIGLDDNGNIQMLGAPLPPTYEDYLMLEGILNARKPHAYQAGGTTYQPQGSQTNGQQYTIQNGVATPVPSRAYGGYYQEGGTAIMLPSMQRYSPSATDSIFYNPEMNQNINRYLDSVIQNRQPMGVYMSSTTGYGNRSYMSSATYSPYMSSKTYSHGGYYQEGGEAMPQEMMEAPQQQMQEQAMGQEQMMQQLMQMVMQALQQGMQPEQIVQMLVQQGVPQDVAVQVIQMVMQQMQGGAPQGGPGQQYQPQGEQYQGPQPMAAYGGYYADGGFFNESYMPFDY